MARAVLVALLLCLWQPSAGKLRHRSQRTLASALLQESQAIVHAAPNPAQAAILALDTDKSGTVEKSEVEVFARQQGLNAIDIESEFSELDTNGDGQLAVEEIMGTLKDFSAKAEPVQAVQEEAANVASNVSSKEAVPAAADTANVSTQVAATKDSKVVEAEVSSAEALLEQQAMMAEATRQADNALAAAFADSASQALSQESEVELKAAKLDKQAKSLRDELDTIAKNAQEMTVAAAANATDNVLQGAQARVRLMEARSRKLGEQAIEHRRKASVAMDKISTAQAKMRAAMTI